MRRVDDRAKQVMDRRVRFTGPADDRVAGMHLLDCSGGRLGTAVPTAVLARSYTHHGPTRGET